jgi:glyoxylase-like metal-dependent hydrolase (beta-lactamase superfamily II)
METQGSGTAGMSLQRVTASTAAAIDPRLQSNAAAIVFEDFVVVVDAGMRPFASRLFRKTLEETYRRPVRFVCVTHKHGDHTFGLTAFKEVTVFGSRRLATALAESPDFAPDARAARKQMEPDGGAWLDEVELVLPELRFEDRMDVSFGGRTVEFHHSGGHTDCSTWGYLAEEKVLFSGDLIFSGMFPFAGDPTADPEVWMATLRLWKTMAIEHVIPGHGPVSGSEEIARQLEFLETLKQNTLAAIATDKGPEDILLPAMYPIGDKPWFAEKTVQRWHEYYRGLV